MSDHKWADNWLTFEAAHPALLRNQSQHSTVHVFKTQLFTCGFQEGSAYWREIPEWKAVNCCHHCSAGEARHSFWVDVCVLDASICWFGNKGFYFLFLCEEFCFVFVCVTVANDSYFQRKRVTNMCTHIEGIFATRLHCMYATGKVQIMFAVDSFDSWKAKLVHNNGFLGRHDKKMTKQEKMSRREG